MSKPKLAVIGASHFQLPLIRTAQRMGCEVHAFAWQCGDVGETQADVFYPISITEVDAIVDACRRAGVQGVCTIASDLATVATCHVAKALGLTANSIDCMRASTNKYLMRKAFAAGGDPSPKSLAVRLGTPSPKGSTTSDDAVVLEYEDLDSFDPTSFDLAYPLIVKPTDRSGSRGITKLEAPGAPVTVADALRAAFEQGFSHEAMVEEFVAGDEFSVEGMSWDGTHHVLAITRKATTGAPHFIETAHLEPAFLSPEVEEQIKAVTTHALGTLGVTVGASHTELKVQPDGTIRLIEVGARMGGDCIGSHLVELSCGIDYVRAVVDAALGREPNLAPTHAPAAAAACFMFDKTDLDRYDRIARERPDLLRYALVTAEATGQAVTDSSTRLGHYVLCAPDAKELAPYLPRELARVCDTNPTPCGEEDDPQNHGKEAIR